MLALHMGPLVDLLLSQLLAPKICDCKFCHYRQGRAWRKKTVLIPMWQALYTVYLQTESHSSDSSVPLKRDSVLTVCMYDLSHWGLTSELCFAMVLAFEMCVLISRLC